MASPQQDEYGRWVVNPDLPYYAPSRYWQPTQEASDWASRAAPALPGNTDLATLYGTGQLSPEVQAQMLANPYSGPVSGQNLSEGFNNWLAAMQSPTYAGLASKSDPASQYFYKNPSQWGQYITRWGAPGGDKQPGGTFSYSPEEFYSALTGQPGGSRFLSEQSSSAQAARHPGPGMGWMVPLGLMAGVAGLQGAGLWGGAGEAAAAGAAPAAAAEAPAVAGGMSYAPGSASSWLSAAATQPAAMSYAPGSIGAGLAGGASLGELYPAFATGAESGALGETVGGMSRAPGGISDSWLGNAVSPEPYMSAPASSASPLTSPSSFTPGGWLDKGSQMLKDYFMPNGKMSLSSLLNPASSIASGFMQSRASKDAALKQVQAAQQAMDMISRQGAESSAALEPYRQAGTSMLSSLVSGLNPGGRYTENFSGVDFEKEPGYLSQLSEGTRAIQNAAASKGMLKSGRTAKEIAKYGQDLAAKTYGDAYNRWRQQQVDDYNRRASIAGLGQTAANQLTSFGNQNAQTLASLLGSQASAAGAGTIGSANAWTGALSNLLGSASQQNILDALRRAGVI